VQEWHGERKVIKDRRSNRDDGRIRPEINLQEEPGRRQLMLQVGTNGTRNRDFKEQLRLRSERTTNGIYRKTIGLEIVKRAVGISSGLRKIRNWTLWRGSTPSKSEEKPTRLIKHYAMKVYGVLDI
jgi:hypothetical protein